MALRAGATLLIAAALALAGCTTVLVRHSVPNHDSVQLSQAAPYGITAPLIRFWGDTLSEEDLRAIYSDSKARFEATYATELRQGKTLHADWLALSGGGADGAFGAGLLAGWQARGDKPDFKLVTGVSTGAIVALFAYLGPEYDTTLKSLYTTHSTSDIAARTFFTGLTRGIALFDTRGYRGLIDSYVDDDLVAKLAARYRSGHMLLIGTTDLDASRPVVWNIGAIAASGSPAAKQLIRDVVQASSAIPAAFPPQLIPVQVGGKTYDEMHVDGGATQQLMLFSPQLSMRRLDSLLGAKVDRTIYVVINNKLRKTYNPVRPRLFAIAGTALSSLIGGSGTGDIYKIFSIAERDGLDLRVIWIPEDFDLEPGQMFDPVYMTALYAYGYEMGKNGIEWRPEPPDYAATAQ